MKKYNLPFFKNTWTCIACCVTLLAVPLSSCVATPQSPTKNIQSTTDSSLTPDQPTIYKIQTGDELDVRFFYNAQLDNVVKVRPDGRISLPLVDDIQAAGLTPMELDAQLTDIYAKELKDPEITVIVKSFTGPQIYVGGEVGQPQPIEFISGLSPLEAVLKAGGLNETAALEHTIVIRRDTDNKPIPYTVDLKKMMYGGAELFTLKPNDIVYIPKSKIAKMNLFVQQYVRDLILFRGFGARL